MKKRLPLLAHPGDSIMTRSWVLFIAWAWVAPLAAQGFSEQAQYDPASGRWLLPTIVRRHDVADANYTAGVANYPAVGRLSSPEGSCTCTLITPDWILTAGHCIDNNGLTPGQYTVNIGGVVRTGAQKVVNPGWTGSLSAGTDIALLRLASPITTITPARLNDSIADVGMLGTHVGRGRTGTGLTGHTTFDDVMRAGTNMQDVTGAAFGWNPAIILTDFDNPTNPADNWFGSPSPSALEAGLAPGDSGGAMFVDFGAGPVLAGVHSFISSQDGSTNMDYGDASGSIRVVSHYAWIAGVTGIPEPSTWLMLGLAAAFGIGTGGRRWQRSRKQVAASED